MTKPTSVEQKVDQLSDKIKHLEEAILSLHDMLASEEVHFELDFPIDESDYH